MAELEQSFDEHDMSGPKNSQPDVDHVEPKNDSKPKETQDDNDTVLGGGETRWPRWSGESVFRLLVPTQKVGGIIGHEGEFLKKMCEETRARIKILDGPHGITESAVLVSAKEEPDASVPPAVAGLLGVHKRVVDGLESDPSLAPPVMGSKVSTRLLVLAAQAESLADKSIQEASGCTVRVLGTENLPLFALQDDRIVEVVGEPFGVHKAVYLIASHLRKFLVDPSVIPIFEMHMQMPNPRYMPPPRKYDNDYPPADMPPPMEKQLHHDISASEVRTAPQLIGSKVAKMDSPSNAQPAPSMITQDQYPLKKDGSMLPYVLYHLQYMKTGGYDVDELPDEWKFSGQSVPECPTDEHKELCEWAIHDHYSNKGHKNEPEFVQVVKAMCEPCAGLNFYLTFEAKDKIDGKVETYQAIVYERFDSTRKLTEFRVKPPGDVQGK